MGIQIISHSDLGTRTGTFTPLQGSEGTLGSFIKIYLAIRRNRIKLVQADTWTEQQKYIDAADYVILA